MKLGIIILTIILPFLALALPSIEDVQRETLTTFAMGSCNKEDRKQPLWPHILNQQPQFFMWMGDNIYGDSRDPKVIEAKYAKQLAKPGYAKVVENLPIIGTWDDHDFGENDAGKEYPMKKETQALLLKFLNEPANSPRWQQQGVYTSYEFGEGENKAKIILLDTRYHRDQPNKPGSDILGEVQWQWLERELAQSDARVHFIVSSISVLSPTIPFFGEQWKNFSKSFRRLFKTLKEYDIPGVIFLTGDRHFSGTLELKVKGRKYHEFMASGMTHSNKHPIVKGLLKGIYGEKYSYFGLNFGLIHMDWSDKNVNVAFQSYGISGAMNFEKKVRWNGETWKKVKNQPMVLIQR